MISAINSSNYGMNVFRSDGGNSKALLTAVFISSSARPDGRGRPKWESLVPHPARKTKAASFWLTADG